MSASTPLFFSFVQREEWGYLPVRSPGPLAQWSSFVASPSFWGPCCEQDGLHSIAGFNMAPSSRKGAHSKSGAWAVGPQDSTGATHLSPAASQSCSSHRGTTQSAPRLPDSSPAFMTDRQTDTPAPPPHTPSAYLSTLLPGHSMWASRVPACLGRPTPFNCCQ